MNAFIRFSRVIAIACLCFFLPACSRVVNEPVITLPQLSVKSPRTPAKPLRVGVLVKFEPGSSSQHVSRADSVAKTLVEHLKKGNECNIHFIPLSQFDNPDSNACELLLKLWCTQPQNEMKKNKPVFIICSPALVSIIFIPIALIGFSIRGVVHEVTRFEWSVTLSKTGNPAELFLEKRLEPFIADVSATAWGTPEEKKTESYCNADTALVAAVIQCMNQVDWQKIN